MRILIIGAGKVGSSVAGNLVSESNDITIVDTNKAKIAEMTYRALSETRLLLLFSQTPAP